MGTDFRTTLMGRTMLFPCAAGVQIPQIGAEDPKIKVALAKNHQTNIIPVTIVPQDVNPVSNKYVKMVTAGLSFTEEVVEDRCLHTMPYDTKYFQGVFQPDGLVTPRPKTQGSMGRHDKRGTDARHMPCSLKKIAKPHPLTPLRKQVKEKAQLMHTQALQEKQKERSKSQNSDESGSQSSFFMTEVFPEGKKSSAVKLKPIVESKVETSGKQSRDTLEEKTKVGILRDEDAQKKTEGVTFTVKESDCSEDRRESMSSVASKQQEGDWDDYLMSKLSKLTANWVVHERMPANNQKTKLTHVLESWYGPPAHTDLVREETSDGEDDTKKVEMKPKTKWKKQEASLLERVYQKTPPPAEALDPYSDDNRAPFYRQPAGIRRKKKSEEKEEAAERGSEVKQTDCAINATAHGIQVRSYVTTPPLTLKDYLSPRVGDKIYETDNEFQQEWLTGQKQVHTIGGDPREIRMESTNKYRKQLQREMPQNPLTWSVQETDKKKGEPAEPRSFMPEKGQRRWIRLPEPVDDTEGTMTTLSAGFDPVFLKAVDPKQRRKVKQNPALLSIVHDWRSKWFLSGQFADSTPEDLIRDMADIQSHVRLKAIGTVAKAAEYKPPLDNSVLLDSADGDPVSDLPEEIFVALECLLDDVHEQVRKAAAITLYSLNRPSEKASERLRQMLHGESEVDRWAAAQCLAHFGESDSDVVAEIIRQILGSEMAIKHEQGFHLLAKISNSSTLVHCMVAEQLNSSSWRHRVIACKILPTLFGSINRDITQKLSEMMWHDWNMEVRKAAAQCLGKTSHGRDVHDDIRQRILNGNERTRMEAITKLGQLGIMTAKLLPAFLECFADPYISIRCEVCITCGNLQIKEEQVLERLVHLATFDPIWKVKALAIQALGKTGVIDEDIKECLIWAMRYEEKAGVRAEACHSLMALNVQDDEVIEVLQERLLVESSQIVRDEMMEALTLFGLSSSEDMDMVAQIKSEVNKLCKRNIIASQIIVNENDETRRAQLKRMVLQTEEDIKALNERKSAILQRIRSQARSSESLGSSPQPRTSTPMRKSKGASESTSPEPTSREGTVFTPTADKELEAILNQEERESMSGSASIKSRPLTEESQAEESKEKVEGSKEEVEESKEKPQSGVESDGVKIPSRITITNVDDDHEDDADIGEKGDGMTEKNVEEEAVQGSDKLSSKNQLSLPLSTSRSQMGMLSPSNSMDDLKGSRLSLAQFSGRRSMMSRESLREREKLNLEVNTIYADLNARYAHMMNDLIRIDKGLNTKASSAESNLKVSIVTEKQIKDEPEQSNTTEISAETVPPNEAGEAHESDEVKEKAAEEMPTNEKEQAAELGVQNQQEDVGDKEEEKRDKEGEEGIENGNMEWKSFVDTLSEDEDGLSDQATSYPSFEEEDNDAALSVMSSAGQTAQASEYEENSVREDPYSDDEELDAQVNEM